MTMLLKTTGLPASSSGPLNLTPKQSVSRSAELGFLRPCFVSASGRVRPPEVTELLVETLDRIGANDMDNLRGRRQDNWSKWIIKLEEETGSQITIKDASALRRIFGSFSAQNLGPEDFGDDRKQLFEIFFKAERGIDTKSLRGQAWDTFNKIENSVSETNSFGKAKLRVMLTFARVLEACDKPLTPDAVRALASIREPNWGSAIANELIVAYAARTKLDPSASEVYKYQGLSQAHPPVVTFDPSLVKLFSSLLNRFYDEGPMPSRLPSVPTVLDFSMIVSNHLLAPAIKNSENISDREAITKYLRSFCRFYARTQDVWTDKQREWISDFPHSFHYKPGWSEVLPGVVVSAVRGCSNKYRSGAWYFWQEEDVAKLIDRLDSAFSALPRRTQKS